MSKEQLYFHPKVKGIYFQKTTDPYRGFGMVSTTKMSLSSKLFHPIFRTNTYPGRLADRSEAAYLFINFSDMSKMLDFGIIPATKVNLIKYGWSK